MDAFPVAQQTTDRPAPPATAPIDSLIQDAQSCLIAQEWRCAAAKYREALTHYAGRPESLALLISLAKLELQHLGAPRQALEHYKTYQRRAPDGPLAEESLYGIAKVYRRLGLIDDEVQTLDRFIDTYPRSPLSNKARARLLQLGRIERQP